MLSPSREWAATDVTAELWRDPHPAARKLPGTSLGTRTLHGAARAAGTALYDAGVRCLELAEPVRLCRDAPPRSARALLLVREATSHGLAVSWTAECDDGCAAHRTYHHLYPPAAVAGAPDEVAAGWWDSYFPHKCLFRRGPGFVEVRDLRFGTLELFTIDAPGPLECIEALTEGVPAGDVPAAVRDTFAEARLVTEHAGHLWWLPMRVYRWPFPSLTV